MRHRPEFQARFRIPLDSHWDSQGFFLGWAFSGVQAHLKKPLQPSQVMALKWKPVALSPQTPQIRDTLRSESPAGSTRDVLEAPRSMAGSGGKPPGICHQSLELSIPPDLGQNQGFSAEIFSKIHDFFSLGSP